MAAIQEVVDGLNDVLPTLPPKVAELVERAEEVKVLLGDVMEDFGKVDAESKELFEKIDDALDEIDKESDNHLQHVSAAIEDLEDTGLEALERELAAMGKEVAQTVAALDTEFGHLRDAVREGSEDLVEAGNAASQGMEAVVSAVDAAKSKLAAALAAAQDAAKELREKLDTVHQGYPDHYFPMEELTEKTGHKIEETLAEARGSQQALAGELADIAANVIREKANEAGSQLAQKITVELRSALGAAAQEVFDAVSALDDKVSESEDSQSRIGDELKPLFDQVQGLLQPIETAVGAVKEAARLVGLDFESA